MMSKHPSMKTNRREPLKIARMMAMITRMAADLFREVSDASIIFCDDIPELARAFPSCCLRLAYAEGLRLPMSSPRMPSTAIMMGNIDISRLYANPAARFIDQSLLNLVKSAIIGLASFSTVTTAPVDVFFCVCSPFVCLACCSFV